MRKRDIFFELLDFSLIHMIIFNSNPSICTLSICLSNKTFKKSKPNTHTQTDQGLSGGGDQCGHACKCMYTLLPSPPSLHHKQIQACYDGQKSSWSSLRYKCHPPSLSYPSLHHPMACQSRVEISIHPTPVPQQFVIFDLSQVSQNMYRSRVYIKNMHY